MPWNAEHKTQSRERILSSAAQLFSHHGFDSVSIDDVMTHAGLTRGLFTHISNPSRICITNPWWLAHSCHATGFAGTIPIQHLNLPKDTWRSAATHAPTATARSRF